MIDQLTKHTVVLHKRNTDTGSTGYLNNNHEWVSAEFEDPVDFKCNIQPLSSSKQKIILPDGVRTDNVLTLRSRGRLLVAENGTEYEGDEVTYEDERYELFKEEDWSNYGLPTDHYKYYIKRKDAR